MTVTKAPDTTLVGKTFDELAAAKGLEGLDYFMDLIIEHDTDLIWKCTSANHRDKVS